MLTEQDYRQALVTRHPFWQALSPTVVKQRIEQLLTAPDAAALVQALSPVEYTILLKEAPEMRPQLLQLTQPEQVRTVLDLDCWNKDTLDSPRLLAWLEDLQHSGTEVFAHTLQVLDAELLVAFIRQHLRVDAALPAEEEDEPKHYDEALTNELYRTEFLVLDSPVNDRVQRLLSFLRLADLDLYHHLMQAAMWEQDTELVEWAYRWKSGRLQDEGFPDYFEALETYQIVDIAQLAPESATALSSPGLPESAEASGLIPSYAWSLTPSGSSLDDAMTGEFAADTLERLCWEMVALCNREFVYDQTDFADAIAVRASLSRVHAYLNIGLEYLRGQNTQRLSPLLMQHSLQFIYQVGFTLVMHLSQRTAQLQHDMTRATGVRRALPSLAQYVFEGLLQKHPQFFEGLAWPAEMGYRDFCSLHDVMLVEPVLRQIETNPAYGGETT